MRPLVLHAVGYGVVLALAVGGTASALAGKNTVFSDDITDGEVRMKDLAPRAADELQLPAAVPGGATVRGTWGFDGEGTEGANHDHRIFVDFPVPFESALDLVHVTGAPTADCPGVKNGLPAAAPGTICVYETHRMGAHSVTPAAVTRLGFQVVVYDDEVAGDIYASGVWAATAP